MANMAHNDDNLNLELEHAEFVLVVTNELNAIQDKFGDIETRLTALENRLNQHYLVINQVLTHMAVHDIETADFVDGIALDFRVVTEGYNQLIEVLTSHLNKHDDIGLRAIPHLNASKVLKKKTGF